MRPLEDQRCGSRRAACRARARQSGRPSPRPSGRRRPPRTSATRRAARDRARSRRPRRPRRIRLRMLSALSSDLTSPASRSTRRARSTSSSSRRRRSACRSRPVPRRHAVDRRQRDLAPLEVEARDLGEQRPHVALSLEDRPQRIATSPRDSAPVATWYVSGWKRWKLCRSTSVMSTGARRRPSTACSPANPPPMTTTRCAELSAMVMQSPGRTPR